MLSRVAESVYWMNRQIERAENVARAVETTLGLVLEGTISPGRLWSALVCTFGDEADFWARYGLADQANVISFLAIDQANANSIASCLQAARENARTVRDMISTAMWQEINKAHLAVRAAAAANVEIEHPREFLEEVKRASQLISGVADATMSHGEAWHFARLGRLVERADKTSRVLDVEHYFQPAAVPLARPASGAAAFGSGPGAEIAAWNQPAAVPLARPASGAGGDGDGDAVRWSAVLESASALEMYRKVHGAISRRRVADFLIFDREFPRAMHFCLIKAEESLLAITGGAKGAYSNPAEQLLGRLRSHLNYGAIDEILGAEPGLHGFIDSFQSRLNEASDAIYATFFALRPVGGGEPAPAAAAGSARRP
ncbi:MAG: alpha-E domain-containing protein [Planctomycetota bacterium]